MPDVKATVTTVPSKRNDILGCGIALLAALNAALGLIYIRKLSDQVHFSLQPIYSFLSMAVYCPIWSLVIPVTDAADLTLYGWQFYAGALGLAMVMVG